MKTLLVKDMKYIAIPLLLLLLLDAILATFYTYLDEPGSFLLFFCLPITVIFVLFTRNHAQGWDKYVNALPFTPQEIVAEKYIIAVGIVLLIQIIMLLFGTIPFILSYSTIDYAKFLVISSSTVLISSITLGIFIPCSISMNPAKGTAVSIFIVLFVLFPIFYVCYSQSNIGGYYTTSYGTSYMHTYIDPINEASTPVIFWITTILGYLTLYGSYRGSVILYQKKDY